jgi:hypothetical protein
MAAAAAAVAAFESSHLDLFVPAVCHDADLLTCTTARRDAFYGNNPPPSLLLLLLLLLADRAAQSDESLPIVLQLSLPDSPSLTPQQARRLLESPALELSADLSYVESFHPLPFSHGPQSFLLAQSRPTSVMGSRPTMPLTPAPQPSVDEADEAFAGVQGTSVASTFWKPEDQASVKNDSGWTGKWLVKATVG